MVTSSRSVPAIAAPKPARSSSAAVAVVTIASYLVTHSALYCRTQ